MTWGLGFVSVVGRSMKQPGQTAAGYLASSYVGGAFPVQVQPVQASPYAAYGGMSTTQCHEYKTNLNKSYWSNDALIVKYLLP